MIPFKLDKILVRSMLLFLASYDRFHPSLTATVKNIQAIACGLYLWVHIRQRLALPLYITPLIPPLHSDGSSSLLSITSGMSSEGANPTDGRFGSVLTGSFDVSHRIPYTSNRPASVGRFIPLRVSPRSRT